MLPVIMLPTEQQRSPSVLWLQNRPGFKASNQNTVHKTARMPSIYFMFNRTDLCCSVSTQTMPPTCPDERLQSLHCVFQSLRSRRSLVGSPAPGSACRGAQKNVFSERMLLELLSKASTPTMCRKSTEGSIKLL